MIVEFDVELPDELIQRGRVLAASRNTTLEEMLVEYIKAIVVETDIQAAEARA